MVVSLWLASLLLLDSFIFFLTLLLLDNVDEGVLGGAELARNPYLAYRGGRLVPSRTRLHHRLFLSVNRHVRVF